MVRLDIKIKAQAEQQGDREEVTRYLSQTSCCWPAPTDSSSPHPAVRLSVCLSVSAADPTSRQYHEALESYKNMAQQIKHLRNFVKSLNKVMNQRQQVYTDMRRQVVAHSVFRFFFEHFRFLCVVTCGRAALTYNTRRRSFSPPPQVPLGPLQILL